MVVATHRIRRYQHPKVCCRLRGMAYHKVCKFEPRTVCWQESWQGNDQYPALKLIKKHAHDSAYGVCKAHVHTIPAKDSDSAPPHSNWTRRELARRGESDWARWMTFSICTYLL